jgi:hypothetical protein
MELNDVQKQTVAQWVKDGLGLSEIQKKIAEDIGISMTYMDVRFLVIELGVDLQEPEVPEVVPPAADATPHEIPESADELSPGGVSVEVDRLVKPGAVVSGTVTFSDGTTASWLLDQMGRLALDAADPEYRPSDEDVQAFQQELRSALQKRGF